MAHGIVVGIGIGIGLATTGVVVICGFAVYVWLASLKDRPPHVKYNEKGL